MKMLVFAGNYKEYRHMMDDWDIPYLHKDWVYVAGVGHVLSCLRNTPYILYGTWFHRPDRERFLKLARGKGFIQVEPIDG